MKINPVVKRTFAFTIVEKMVGVALASVVLVITLVNLNDAHKIKQQKACIENLTFIQAAKITWAKELGKAAEDIPTDADLFGADKYIAKKPVCPVTGEEYALGMVWEKPMCSYATRYQGKVLLHQADDQRK